MNRNIELVQIIIPLYNTGHLIKRCVESCLHQTYGNVRVLCIDDGSTDNSMCVLKELSVMYPDRLFFTYQPNKGAAAARNTGLKYSSNDGYIMFVDSDDYLGPEYVELFISAIGKSDVCVCANGDVEKDLNSVLLAYLKHRISVGPYKRLIKSSLAKSVFFDESLFVGEDYDYNIQIFIKSKTISILDWNKHNIPYYSGNHENPLSLMRTINQKSIFDNFYKWLKVYNLTCHMPISIEYYVLLNDALAESFLTMYALYNFSYKLDVYHQSMVIIRSNRVVKKYRPKRINDKIKRLIFLYFRPFYRMVYFCKRKHIL